LPRAWSYPSKCSSW